MSCELKLDKKSYYDLSILLTSLERDINTFNMCLMKPPTYLTSLVTKIKDEQFKRAETIPVEKLIYDLDIKNLKILKNG